MNLAVVDRVRAEATPGGRGTCPTCSAPVLAKCGTVTVWHWAHQSGSDCDTWSEPDSVWHRRRQECAHPLLREVTIGRHRADVITVGGTVVELQHSYLSAEEIAEREAFYGPNMVWIWDASEAVAARRFQLRRALPGGASTFRWKHPRKTIAACKARVLIDLGDGWVFHIKAMHADAPCGGWGRLVLAEDVADWMYLPPAAAVSA